MNAVAVDHVDGRRQRELTRLGAALLCSQIDRPNHVQRMDEAHTCAEPIRVLIAKENQLQKPWLPWLFWRRLLCSMVDGSSLSGDKKNTPRILR